MRAQHVEHGTLRNRAFRRRAVAVDAPRRRRACVAAEQQRRRRHVAEEVRRFSTSVAGGRHRRPSACVHCASTAVARSPRRRTRRRDPHARPTAIVPSTSLPAMPSARTKPPGGGAGFGAAPSPSAAPAARRRRTRARRRRVRSLARCSEVTSRTTRRVAAERAAFGDACRARRRGFFDFASIACALDECAGACRRGRAAVRARAAPASRSRPRQIEHARRPSTRSRLRSAASRAAGVTPAPRRPCCHRGDEQRSRAVLPQSHRAARLEQRRHAFEEPRGGSRSRRRPGARAAADQVRRRELGGSGGGAVPAPFGANGDGSCCSGAASRPTARVDIEASADASAPNVPQTGREDVRGDPRPRARVAAPACQERRGRRREPRSSGSRRARKTNARTAISRRRARPNHHLARARAADAGSRRSLQPTSFRGDPGRLAVAGGASHPSNAETEAARPSPRLSAASSCAEPTLCAARRRSRANASPGVRGLRGRTPPASPAPDESRRGNASPSAATGACRSAKTRARGVSRTRRAAGFASPATDPPRRRRARARPALHPSRLRGGARRSAGGSGRARRGPGVGEDAGRERVDGVPAEGGRAPRRQRPLPRRIRAMFRRPRAASRGGGFVPHSAFSPLQQIQVTRVQGEPQAFQGHGRTRDAARVGRAPGATGRPLGPGGVGIRGGRVDGGHARARIRGRARGGGRKSPIAARAPRARGTRGGGGGREPVVRGRRIDALGDGDAASDSPLDCTVRNVTETTRRFGCPASARADRRRVPRAPRSHPREGTLARRRRRRTSRKTAAANFPFVPAGPPGLSQREALVAVLVEERIEQRAVIG